MPLHRGVEARQLAALRAKRDRGALRSERGFAVALAIAVGLLGFVVGLLAGVELGLDHGREECRMGVVDCGLGS